MKIIDEHHIKCMKIIEKHHIEFMKKIHKINLRTCKWAHKWHIMSVFRRLNELNNSIQSRICNKKQVFE